MSTLSIPERRRTRLLALCLVAAPLAGLIEALLSPLGGGSTADDFAAIASAPGRFTAAVLIGLAGTVLLVPALLGLAGRTSARSPRLALVASAAIVISMLGFAGVRMAQAFELGLATGPLTGTDPVETFEKAIGTPIGVTLTVMFLVGNILGMIVLAIALWRSHTVPVGAVVLFLLFPVLDTVVHGHFGPVVSHALLLVSLTWMALTFLNRTTASMPHFESAVDPA